MTTEIVGININLFPIIKAGLEIFLIIYAVIAVVVIKQIDLMTRTIKSKFNRYLYFLAYTHLVVVMLILIITFFAL